MFLQVVADGVMAGALYALIAVGFALWAASSRFINIGYLAVFAAAPYAAWTCWNWLDLAVPLAVFFGICSGVVVGCAFHVSVFAPVRRRGGGGLALFLASVGLYTAFGGLLSLVFGEVPLSFEAASRGSVVSLVGIATTPVRLATFAVSAVVVGALAIVLFRTRLGRMVRAIMSDRGLAVAVGVDVQRNELAVVVMGSAIAAAAGILHGYDTDLVPSMGFDVFLAAVAAALLGGLKRPVAVATAAMLVGLVEHLSVLVVATEWQSAVVYVLLMVALLWRSTQGGGSVLPVRS